MPSTVHAQIRVQGQVQGVGFRPFVYRLANELGLAGWVRNDGGGVEIALEGAQQQVYELVRRLRSETPALARVENILLDFKQPLHGLRGFSITASGTGPVHTGIVPDAAVCADCLSELFDAEDRRRYRYPFINCMHCGPRYTLTARLPYDRLNTSMAAFTQCPACQREYDDPDNRRFHAQPNACKVCGPQLHLYDAMWQKQVAEDPVRAVAARLNSGKVVAMKGLGGFHLVCDARNGSAVARLRNGKQRDEKPFAVMVPNLASARQFAEISAQEAALLESTERPVVLLRKSRDSDRQLADIAPGLSRIGLMLPSTPLHYLLFHALSGMLAGRAWLDKVAGTVLVMTSANPGGEPLVKDDSEAQEYLAGLADAYLTHDREIVHRCDDSVMRWQGRVPAFVRRARGFVPRPIALPFDGPSVLACGAWLKNTICVTRGNEAFVSPHIGDLGHAGACRVLEETVAHFCDMLEVEPQAVAHDLHPDFFSTRFAQDYAARKNIPVIPVQHHYAHVAALCAEHGVTAPVLGLALDGIGLGDDDAAWGGELLRVDGAQYRRLGYLKPLRMPGGDQAAREPWRMAAAVLHALGRADEISARFSAHSGAGTVATMLRRGLNSPATSSMGRLFDAAAGLLGVMDIQNYEGQAAMRLEALAERYGRVEAVADGYQIDAGGVLDFSPLLAMIADCDDPAFGAALFHATVAEALAAWAVSATQAETVDAVALGGGCLLNGILSVALTDKLEARGLRVLTAHQVPPNDGGIALGQAWVALTMLKQGNC